MAGIDGGGGEGDPGLEMIRGEHDQRFDAGQPVMRRVAGADIGIADGEVGMRGILPGSRQHAGGLVAVALAGEDAAGDDGCRHEIGRDAMGFGG